MPRERKVMSPLIIETLVCDHSKESYWAVLSSGSLYYPGQGGSAFTFVNTTPVCDHSDKLLSSTFAWYCSLVKIAVFLANLLACLGDCGRVCTTMNCSDCIYWTYCCIYADRSSWCQASSQGGVFSVGSLDLSFFVSNEAKIINISSNLNILQAVLKIWTNFDEAEDMVRLQDANEILDKLA